MSDREGHGHKAILYKSHFPPLRHSLLERHRCIHRLINHIYTKGQSTLLFIAPTTVYMDNNPLTYVLSSAKLDAIGQCWVASLAPYNFSLHYNPGRQNVVADSLSRILWENLFYQNSLNFNVVKAVIDKGEVNTTACIEPDVLEEKLTLQVHQLVDSLAGKMTKQQWKNEQESDSEIAPFLSLVKQNKHLQYQIQKTDEAGSKIL